MMETLRSVAGHAGEGRSVARQLVIGVGVAAAAALLKGLTNSALGNGVGFGFDYPAILLTTLYGGLGAGLVTVAACTLFEDWFFLQPTGSLIVADPAQAWRLVLFAVAGGLFALIVAYVRGTRSRAERARSDEARARREAELAAARASALASIAAALSATSDPREIGRLVTERGMVVLGASRGAAYRIVPDGQRIEALHVTGIDVEETDTLNTLSIEAPLPAAEAMRTRRMVLVPDAEAYRLRYPADGSADLPAPSAAAALPLETEGNVLGVVSWRFDTPHEFATAERDFLYACAALAAQALSRVQAHASEEAATRREGRSQERLDMMARAGRILGTSLDVDTTLLALARLPLPVLGDFCVVDLVDGTQVRRLVAAASGADAADAEELQGYPLDIDSDNPLAVALRTGQTSILDVDEALLHKVASSDAHLHAVRALGLRRVLIVPMEARGRAIGTLMFATKDPAHQFEAADVAGAEVLASRAAKAIENARLHREVQRLAEREALRAADLGSLIAALGEGILLADADGRIHAMNGAAERMLGGTVADREALGERLTFEEGALPAPGIAYGPVEARLATRPNTWLELTAYALDDHADSHGLRSVYVVRDVTAFRQGQGLREAFLSLLSHEVRTPVTTIYAAANVLSRPGSRLSPETRTEILEDMVGESDRLYRLVEDLMVLARFDEGLDLARDPSLLQHLVPDVVAGERNRWPQVQFETHTAPRLPSVSGDETSIQQVLRNLLSNAAKYSPVGSMVRVEVSAESDGCSVRVLDEGPGIPAEEAEQLFEPFYRSASTARMAGGAGIGLYVSRRLMDAMGGRIWATPRPVGGSEFGFWLPEYLVADDGDQDDDDVPEGAGPALEREPASPRPA